MARISDTLAPFTLRMPISFVFPLMANNTKPTNPIQEIRMLMIEKIADSFENRISFR